jgi:hypothetical protein
LAQLEASIEQALDRGGQTTTFTLVQAWGRC